MLRITKKSIFFEFVEVVDGKESTSVLDVFQTNLGIVSYLNFQATIEDDVTVEDMFKHIAKTPEAIDFAFDSSLGGHALKPYIDEMSIPTDPDKNLVYLEIAHEMDPMVEDGELFDIRRFRGVAKDGDIYSVELSPIASYKKLPLKLNTSYILFDDEGNVVLETYKLFTLHDIIHAMLYEVSYHGEPSAREEIFNEVVSKHKKTVSAESSEQETVDSLTKALMKVVEAEDYEKAAKIRDRIRQMSADNQKDNPTIKKKTSKKKK